MTTKNTHGGAGRGQGRKPLPEDAPRKSAPRVRMSIDFTSEQAVALDDAASAAGVSRSEFVRRAVLSSVGMSDDIRGRKPC